MAEELKVVSGDFIHVFVTSTVNSFGTERKFAKSLTVQELKNKLELLTGAPSISMEVEAYTKDNKLVCKLEKPTALLGSYPIDDNMTLKVIDSVNEKGVFEDMSNVEKFELTEEKYSQRTDTVKSFLSKNKMGKYNQEEMKKKEEERKQQMEEEEKAAGEIKVGLRCEVSVPNQPVRRGTVMYVGEVHFKPGYWVGVKYDEPLGKNNGSVEGKKYFECEAKYGGFVKPCDVKTGDYPELTFELDEI